MSDAKWSDVRRFDVEDIDGERHPTIYEVPAPIYEALLDAGRSVVRLRDADQADEVVELIWTDGEMDKIADRLSEFGPLPGGE